MRKTGTFLLTAALATSGAWAYAAAGDKAPRGSIASQAGAGAGTGGETRAAGAGASAVGGGVSIEAREQLQAKRTDNNVRMVFSLTTGNYLADVDVRVRDARGNVVLEGVSDGPWLMASLPPGNYTAEATYGGQTLTQRFSVGRTGMRTAHFRWPPSVERQMTQQSGVTTEAAPILGTGPQQEPPL
jgi:hypothetical protein